MRRVDTFDEPDLYPADVERLTPELRHQRNRAIAGVALVTIGCGLLTQKMFGLNLNFWAAALGLGLLAGWVQAPRFKGFAFGSIILGFGLSDLVKSMFGTHWGTPIGFLLIAAGFFAVYVRYPRHARWAIVPAGVFGIVSVGSFGLAVINVVPNEVSGMLLPLMLVTAGALLLFRHSLPRPLVKCGLVAAAIVFVSAGTSGVGHLGALNPGFGGGPTDVPVPALEGRTLIVNTTSGNVHINTAEVGQPMVRVVMGRGDRFGRRVSFPSPPVVTPQAVQLLVPPDGDYTITVPPDAALQVKTSSGDISAIMSSAAASAFSSASGDITIDVVPGLPRMAPTTSLTSPSPSSSSTSSSVGADRPSADLSVSTSSGDVTLNNAGAAQSPTVAVRTQSGEVTVNGQDHGHEYTHEGSGRRISVRTASGNVAMTGV